MKLFFLATTILTLASFSAQCKEKGNNAKCSDCSDTACVLQKTDKIAKQYIGKKALRYQKEIDEEVERYIVTYTNPELLNNPNMRGGSLYVIISKKDCKVVDWWQTR